MKRKMMNKGSVSGRLRSVLAAAVLTMGFAVCAGGGLVLHAAAQDNVAAENVGTEMSGSRFFTTGQHIDAKAEPNDGAETVFSYEAGTTICVNGEEAGWYTVFYQGQTGYIKITDVQDTLTPVEMDVAGLDAEMEEETETSRMIIEETERYRAEARRSRIWAAVIVVLIAAVFAMGIISTVRAEKEKAGKENDKRQTAQETSGPQRDNEVPGKRKAAKEMEEEDILDLDRE